MEWEQLRAHYARLFRASGLTQKQLAKAAGLSQNLISKLMHNRRQGPVVGTLLRAVPALGVPLSVFFAQIEEAEAGGPVPGLGVPPGLVGAEPEWEAAARLRRITEALRAFEEAIRGPAPPAARRRRRHKKRPA